MFEGIVQPTHLLFILIVALIFFGPRRLPEMGRSLGRSIVSFRSGLNDGPSVEEQSGQEEERQESETRRA